jgi:hypothetical protein
MTKKIVGLALVALGLLALVYGGFTYTKETHDAKVGPVEFSVKEKERVNVPVWVGAAAVIVGAVVLVVDRRGR